MHSPGKAFVLGVLFSLLSLCFTANALNIPPADSVEKRTSGCNACARRDVAAVIKTFSKYSSVSNDICAKLLHRPPPGTKTTTKITTKTVTSTCTKPTTIVAKQGTSFVSVSVTKTNAQIDTATATVSAIITTTAVSTETNTDTITQTITAPAETVTITTTTAAYVQKRNKQDPCLGELFHGLPKEISVIFEGEAIQACDCFLKPPVTVTVTSTSTAHATTTLTVTKSSTILATTVTTTIPNTITMLSTSTATVTAYATTTVTGSTTITATGVTTITVTPPIATQYVYDTVTYSQISLPSNNCIYNEYYNFPTVNNDPTNNYQAGVRECEDLCTADANCQFWFFLHYDPNKSRGYDGSACIMDNEPYNPAFLQCGYVDNYNVAYNKNPSSQ
ncbi:hypothetical protein TRIATDRAFT_93365 [Trichoderma atroviride IMI 206040]|uniref:Apple domain-containing protein n=2 Tax=Hypocrea atroviridis TaxID=63577 RepID=G9NFN7_HYPAI|nr:uncharacterized protein TRIATDRAFT_93365 [Trichoderma atroviride IMI 206040]EHK50752.1 hypothetical protein TRIATDRAFT_93365 [Trichoderma atroviride IMI 206040]